MPKKRLTATNVRTLPLKNKPYHVWDHGTDAAQGLGVLVSPNGVRTYRAVYYYPGSSKPHAMKLGRVGEMALDEARDKTREVRGLARRGLDPKQGDPARSDNFRSAIETWTEKEQVGRKQNKSADECQSFILNSCKAWHHRAVATIMHHEIDDLLTTKREYAPYAANRLHAHLATFFNWCIRTHRISLNPMAGMPRPWDGAKARDREWFEGKAADEVICALWMLADRLGGDSGKFIKLLLITGKRKNAVLTMQWDHISADWYWTPTLGNKRKRCNPIPLPKLAQRLLGPHRKFGRVLASFGTRNLIKAVRDGIKVSDFIWHGTRHIFQTKLGELRLPFHVRSLLMDHAAMHGSDRGYDHHSYKDEMLEALERWCAHIEALVSPEGVRRLR